MIIYKEKQFLVFDFEDGKNVKYDFATKSFIGKRGKPVKSLNSQLKGITIHEVIRNCKDKNYSDFLEFVYNNRWSYRTSNIATILADVPRYSRFEQFFSAGIGHLVDSNVRYSIGDIPKGLIKICRENQIRLTNNLIESYKKNPDAVNFAFSLKLENMSARDIVNMFEQTNYVCDDDGFYHWVSTANLLINEYNYNPKRLFTYIDDLITYEGLDNPRHIITEIYDYARMMKRLSNKFDKYPHYFLSTHKIACRNYNRLKQKFKEEKFQERMDLTMEKTFGDYVFMYPKSTQAIKDEAVSQNNCVASYIQSVIDGRCHILFLRHKDTPEQSLVTIEVRGNKIVQARQRYNALCTAEQKEAVDKWNEWRAKQVKKEEGDGYACKVA